MVYICCNEDSKLTCVFILQENTDRSEMGNNLQKWYSKYIEFHFGALVLYFHGLQKTCSFVYERFKLRNAAVL